MPLKFGPEVVTHTTLARVALTVETRDGKRYEGWGETPLSVQWVWPSTISYDVRHDRLCRFCERLVEAWCCFEECGDVMQLGYAFQRDALQACLAEENSGHSDQPLPYLAALVCSSPFDLALHDAFGKACDRPIYEAYTSEFLNADLASYLQPAESVDVSFAGKYPGDFLVKQPAPRIPAWHLVGGLDPLEPTDLTGQEPSDGYPVLLRDWIRADGLRCLKIKLRGNDIEWDYQRICRVGAIAESEQVPWLTTDFNCTVLDPAYVVEILDRLVVEHPRYYGMILYVEQPFPYELDQHPIDVHACSARKPLFMDESAHDWQHVRRGRELGWTGVALKTCKTQTGALLSLCWAKCHGMTLMVQDLSNPMLAQLPHVQLGRYAGTIMGVESNGMQFFPQASAPEATVHAGLYKRCDGMLDASTVHGNGFGYQLERIPRELPKPVVCRGEISS
jgi:L-alanine-DL-glutamate epimerase-like enolase superfamily enzyme